MKKIQFNKNSIVRRYIFLMGVFIGAFLLLAGLLLYSFYELNEEYTSKNRQLEDKERLVQDMEEAFLQAFMDVRGYFAYGSENLKDNALEQEPQILDSMKELEEMEEDFKDQSFLNEVDKFREYYFTEALPVNLGEFEKGNIEAVKAAANEGATNKIEAFMADINEYNEAINDQIDANFDELKKIQSYVQFGFVVFVLAFLIVLLRITRLMFSEIARPLAGFAAAANEIAYGREAVIEVEKDRNDELGVLSIAFNRMLEGIQENEQNLLAQNEELVAQQDELHAQQLELQEALEIVKNNEQKLSSRNELINKLANSLDKQEVMESAVLNMCPIIGAEKGIIAFIEDSSYASYGISPGGVGQFLNNLLFSGVVDRLKMDRKPFAMKRQAAEEEKGFHTENLLSFDLYIPIFLSGKKLIAVMAFSRNDAPFDNRLMEEYEAMAKNVGIAMDKVNLYQASEEARRLNQDILDTIQEGVQLVNTEGKILQVNKKFCELFRCPEKLREMDGCSWADWIVLLEDSIEEAGEFINFLKSEVASQEKYSSNEEQFIYKNKEGKVFKVYCEGLFDGNTKLGTIFVHRNITKEFEVDRIKSEFVSTVSHELRTPLASILGFTELMLNRELKLDRQKKYLSTIHNEAGRLTDLINDFLDIQRMESGKQEYEKKQLAMLLIIKKVIELQKVHSESHELSLEFLGGRDFVIGDAGKLEQALTNLIHNAIKYSPEGGRVGVVVFEKDGRVKIEIQDEGLGIPPEALDRLFEKFYRVDNSDRRSIGGTGLGLAIVKEIIHDHGGDISVKSQFGKGSTFTISLPVSDSQTV
ncbi:ATP-binding protein [Mesobacillus jeotgali]|uniref:histidine kinase n=1 Tax=Mesobacillus jeotgali TaxID=129985 RepID=A0ABY9VIZ8_9BACI|nr:ATP-binding protein [Mesobacillus jeotgali]WNF23936.1 ATP-binding protein [Mesobacillus jeotgali]